MLLSNVDDAIVITIWMSLANIIMMVWIMRWLVHLILTPQLDLQQNVRYYQSQCVVQVTFGLLFGHGCMMVITIFISCMELLFQYYT